MVLVLLQKDKLAVLCARRLHKTAEISLHPSSFIHHPSVMSPVGIPLFQSSSILICLSSVLSFCSISCHIPMIQRFFFALISRNQVWEFPQVSSCRWLLSSQLFPCQKHAHTCTHIHMHLKQLRLCDQKCFRERVWLACGSKCFSLYWPGDVGSAKQES